MAEQRPSAPDAQEKLDALSEEDRVWLAERLVEYKDLLEFLHAMQDKQRQPKTLLGRLSALYAR